MSALIGALRVTLGLDSAAFEKGASAVEKRAKGMVRTVEAHGKAMTDLGKTMSVAVTAPLVAFGVKSVQAAIESRDAMGQVEAALKSMGTAAGRTSDQLGDMAGNLMHNSLYDDDDILRKVTANLLTFGNIAGDQFDRAQQAAVDLAARMNMDLQPATLLVGKALNDPIKGMGALRKAGIQLTEQQQNQIKSMVKLGDVAGAQKVLLAELEKQFGGSAAAAQKANPFDTLKDSMADFMEQVGGQLIEILPNITAALTRIIDAFGALSPGMQQAVVVGGMLTAALGPVLTVLGTITSAMAPFLGVLGTAFAEGGILLAAKAALVGLGAALGPILLPLAALAGAGALIYANWEKISPVLSEFWHALQAALGPPLQQIVTEMSATLTELWNGPLGEALRQVIGLIGDLVVWQAKAFGPVFIALLRAAAEIVGSVLGVIGDALKTVSRLLQGDWSGAWEAAKSFAINAFNVINTAFAGLPGFVADVMMRMVYAISGWVGDRLNAIWDSAARKIDWVKQKFYDLYDAVVGHSYIPDMVDGIAAQMLRLDSVMVDKADKATSKTKEAFRKLAAEVQPLLDRLFPEATAINSYNADLGTISKAQKAGILTGSMADEARHRLAMEGRSADTAISSMMAGPLVQDIDKVNEAFDRLLNEANNKSLGVQAATVRIAKSFKDMAQETISSLQNLANAIKGGGFLDIVSAVLDFGLQLGSIGAFGQGVQGKINSFNIPGYANGTNFHPGGWAMVGERGPELVNMPRGSAVFPHGTGPSGGMAVQVLPSKYFDVHVFESIGMAAPSLIEAGGERGYGKIMKKSRRSLVRPA